MRQGFDGQVINIVLGDNWPTTVDWRHVATGLDKWPTRGRR